MSNPSRVSKGVPTGGQFAPGSHQEPDVKLLGPGSAPAREGDGLAGHDRAVTDGRMREVRHAAAAANRALANESARSLARTILARHPDAVYLELVDSEEEYGKVRAGAILDERGNPLPGTDQSPAYFDGDPMAGTLPEQLVENLDLNDVDAEWRRHVESPDLEDSAALLDLKSAAAYGPNRGWVQDLTSTGPASEADVLQAQQMRLDAQVRELQRRNDMLVVAEMSQRVQIADPSIAFVDVTVDDEDRDRLWPTRMCTSDGAPYDADRGGDGEPGQWEMEDSDRPLVTSMVRDLQLHGFGTWDRYATEVDDGGEYGPPTWRIDLKAAAGAHREQT